VNQFIRIMIVSHILMRLSKLSRSCAFERRSYVGISADHLIPQFKKKYIFYLSIYSTNSSADFVICHVLFW